MATARSYLALEAWRKAMDLVEACYGLALRLPAREDLGTAKQLQKAAVSFLPQTARAHAGHYQRSVSIAQSSLLEFETHILLIQRLHQDEAVEAETLLNKAAEIGRMLGGLPKVPQSKGVRLS